MKQSTVLKIILFVGLIAFGLITQFKKMPDGFFSHNMYSSESASIMKELGVYEKIIDSKYSKTVEAMLINNKFNKDFLNEYLKIKFVDNDLFLDYVNDFLAKGYNGDEVNNIFSYLSESNTNKLLNRNYTKLDGYFEIQNFNVDKMDRYNSYISEKEISIEDAVTQVNIGLDLDYYTEITEVDNPDDLLVLVNKYRALPADYEPTDLVSLSNGSQFKLRKVAADAYEELIDYAEENGIEVLPFSGYRSYNTQKVIYNNHVNNNGREKADTYSARPGHSEHQLGLAVDIRSKDYELKRLTPEDAKWINENCSKFGFIVRYTKEDEYITGYMEETWHLRYVGKEVAEEVKNLGITYDEYYDLYIAKY